MPATVCEPCRHQAFEQLYRAPLMRRSPLSLCLGSLHFNQQPWGSTLHQVLPLAPDSGTAPEEQWAMGDKNRDRPASSGDIAQQRPGVLMGDGVWEVADQPGWWREGPGGLAWAPGAAADACRARAPRGGLATPARCSIEPEDCVTHPTLAPSHPCPASWALHRPLLRTGAGVYTGTCCVHVYVCTHEPVGRAPYVAMHPGCSIVAQFIPDPRPQTLPWFCPLRPRPWHCPAQPQPG